METKHKLDLFVIVPFAFRFFSFCTEIYSDAENNNKIASTVLTVFFLRLPLNLSIIVAYLSILSSWLSLFLCGQCSVINLPEWLNPQRNKTHSNWWRWWCDCDVNCLNGCCVLWWRKSKQKTEKGFYLFGLRESMILNVNVSHKIEISQYFVDHCSDDENIWTYACTFQCDIRSHYCSCDFGNKLIALLFAHFLVNWSKINSIGFHIMQILGLDVISFKRSSQKHEIRKQQVLWACPHTQEKER